MNNTAEAPTSSPLASSLFCVPAKLPPATGLKRDLKRVVSSAGFPAIPPAPSISPHYVFLQLSVGLYINARLSHHPAHAARQSLLICAPVTLLGPGSGPALQGVCSEYLWNE